MSFLPPLMCASGCKSTDVDLDFIPLIQEIRSTILSYNNHIVILIFAVTEDKRRSVADFRDNSALYELEKPSISVKALSALYLSKVAAAEPAGNVLKPVSTCSYFWGQGDETRKCC